MENYEIIDFIKISNNFEKNKDIKSICISGNIDVIKKAKFTICIPTYKRPELLKRAILSVLKQETTIPYCVYVLDNENDFSETETYTVIKQFNDERLIYFKNEENLGMVGNWNRCAELVNTEYFAFLHDDDDLCPHYINTISKYIEQKKYDVIYPGFEHINSPYASKSGKKKLWGYAIDKILPSIIKVNLIDNLFLGVNIYGPPTCGIVINKNFLVKSGGFNSEYYPSLDWVFFIYCNLHGRCIKLRKKLGNYYWYDNESLKNETIKKFTFQKRQILDSIAQCDFKGKKISKIFQNDFDKILNSPFSKNPDHLSFFFRIIQVIIYYKYFGLKNRLE